MVEVTIEDYTPPVKENPYTPVVAKLADAGEGKVARFDFDSEKDAQSALGKIQAAALVAERSARRVGELEVVGEGDDAKYVLRVKLAPKQKRRTPEQLAADKAEKEASAAGNTPAAEKTAK